MPTVAEELLNVYDPSGTVAAALPRSVAKESGLILGAVHALIVNCEGEVLLQRRQIRDDNGGLWDKSVGGHVAAGEDFDQTVVRESGEELFDEPGTPRVRQVASIDELHRLSVADLGDAVVLARAGFQLNLRDVRFHARDIRSATYHVAVYFGRTRLRIESFRPQPSEIASLRYFRPIEIDRHLATGELAPNMGFLWMSYSDALLRLFHEP